ncbi:MAG: hypothetical protein WAO00_08320 [Chthoniobacterales bacterium]
MSVQILDAELDELLLVPKLHLGTPPPESWFAPLADVLLVVPTTSAIKAGIDLNPPPGFERNNHKQCEQDQSE